MNKILLYNLLLLIFISASFHMKAQSDEKGKWSAGVVFSPDYSFRLIKFPDEDEHWKEQLDEMEHPILGYTTGISLLYRLNNKSELESGLLFSAKGFAYKVPGEEGWQMPDAESSAEWELNDPALPLEATTTYNYRYVDIPLKMNWFFLQKKVRFFLSAGVSASLFLNEIMAQEAIYVDRTETDRYNQDDVEFNAVALGLTGGAGVEYPLSDRLLIRLNPEFRHTVTPLADTPGKYYLWSAGINTGIFLK